MMGDEAPSQDEPPLRRQHYMCCFAGCSFQHRKHQGYVRHLITAHRTGRYKCNHLRNCPREFTDRKSLLRHIKETHGDAGASNTVPVADNPIYFALKCHLPSCLGVTVPSQSDLMAHFKREHSNEMKICPYENCSKSYLVFNSLKNHILVKHKSKGHRLKLILQPDLGDIRPAPATSPQIFDVLPEIDPDVLDSEDSHPGSPDLHTQDDSDDFDEDMDQGIQEHEVRDFQQGYAHFLNGLLCFHFVSLSSIVKINNEIQDLMAFSSRTNAEHFKAAMREKEIPDATLTSVLASAAVGENLMKKTFDFFSNSKRIEKYFEANFDYVKPRTVSLGKGTFQYVPIRKVLKKIVADKTFQRHRTVPRTVSCDDDDDDLLEDLADGKVFKTNKFFIANRDALKLILYSDVVQVTNPLAGSKHKIFCLYMTLADIPLHERSKIDNIFVIAVADYKIMKDKLKEVLKPLLKDLKKAQRGINGPQAGLLVYTGDNLELNELGMYQRHFNSGHVCRKCVINHSNLVDCSGYLRHEAWSEENYDRIGAALENARRLEEDGMDNKDDAIEEDEDDEDDEDDEEDEEDEDHEEEENEVPDDEEGDEEEEGNQDEEVETVDEETGKTYGLRGICPLNSLESFHATRSFAQDFMHDFLGNEHK